MKKLIATVICLFVITMSAMPLAAQTRNRRYQNRTYSTRYDNRNVYRGRTYDPRYDNKSIATMTTSTMTTTSMMTTVQFGRSTETRSRRRGALSVELHVGGLIGGKKGAIIGAIAGGAGAAIYTYKIRDKYPTLLKLV